VSLSGTDGGRRPGQAAVLAALALACVVAVAPRRAAAIPACTAADVVQADPGCPPGTGACTVTRVFEIGNGCTLDFGARDLIIGTDGEFDLASNSVTLRSKSLTVRARGTIAGSGGLGPIVCIETTGDVHVQRGVGRGVIDVSADELGGCLDIDAGGSVIVDGDLMANQTGIGGNGGEILVTAGGMFTSSVSSVISASGGGDDSTGGVVDIFASGGVQMAGPIDVTGAEGNEATIASGGNLVVAAIDASAKRGANSGGSINLEADRSITIAGNLMAHASGPDELAGSCGGSIVADAFFGDLTVAARVEADGSSPDGVGGCIELVASGNVAIQSNGRLSVTTLGIFGCGGGITLTAGIDLIHAGSMNASGGAAGGFVDLAASRLANITGDIDVQGRDAGAFGGDVTIESGFGFGPGEVRIAGLLNVSGGICSFENDCGSGGSISLTGCVVNVQAAGRVFSVAPSGGGILGTARKQMTIAGRLDATTNAPSQGGDGEIRFVVPPGAPPLTTGSTIDPPATVQTRALCTELPPSQCLIPCPTCGNGAIEFPETCDAGSPVPMNCANGCSSTCQLQNCDDGLICTRDLCDPRLGCFGVPTVTPCSEPTSTPTITLTPTITGTPTISGTPTNTPLITNTPTATPTPVSGRPGDANCDRVIDVTDRLAIERAIFEGTSCTGADVNLDGSVTATDLAAFVHNSPT
jgi:hypothetical protein